MGNSQGRDNVKKRASRRKKTERLALAKKNKRRQRSNASGCSFTQAEKLARLSVIRRGESVRRRISSRLLETKWPLLWGDVMSARLDLPEVQRAVSFGKFAKMSAVSGRFSFVCAALLVLFANVAFGDGTYQRTKNGRTLVWNDHPKPGDEATWWGDRDREGYARGFGTLT